MLKKVRIKIETDRMEISGSLFDQETAKNPPSPDAAPQAEHLEMLVEGRLHDDGSRFSISYRESELSGMEGSSTTVSFRKNEAGVISMMRNGTVKTALIFEEGRRHLCYYQTPIMPFEVCVYTKRVENTLDADGQLILDYSVELRGAATEATHLKMTVLPHFDKPVSEPCDEEA